jgi:hypothetical protein
MLGAAFSGDPALDAWVGEKVVIEGVVSDEPDGRENNVRLPVRVTSVASTTVASGVKVLVVAPLHTDAAYGDIVRAEGALRLPEAFDAGAGREFNYPAFLAKDGIGYELSFARVAVIGEASRNPLKAAAIWIKRTYLEGLAMALAEPEAGLAGGITAGDKRGLGDLSGTFRTVGLIHIVVLSGYNIMVVIHFIEKRFSWARLWVRSAIGICIAALFALMTGLASSSVRAAAMAVIATTGKMTGRIYVVERALGVVAVFYGATVSPAFRSLTLENGATAAMPGNCRSASASPKVNVGVVPLPMRTPPVVDAPGNTTNKLLPILAIVSLTLAVMNALPIPALDGGRLLFVAIEAVKRSRLSSKWTNRVNVIGFILLMGLMVIVTIKDIVGLFTR